MVTPESFFHVAVKTTDLDRSVVFYRGRLDGDVPFVMEPTDFGPLRVAFFRSPGGTRIELIETAGG